jgi:hypothetical protein
VIQAYIVREKFNGVVADLSAEDMERIALAFSGLFSKEVFDFGEPDAKPGPAKARSTSMNLNNAAPRPRVERKARAPKDQTDSELADERMVCMFLRTNGNARSADIVVDGMDADRKNAAVKRLFKKGVLRSNGQKGAGCRYNLVNGAEQVEA